jgi:predicted permease
MPIMKQLKSLLRNITRKAQVEQDLDDEIRSYLAMSVDEKILRGASHDEAVREARIEIGGAEQVKEEVRAVRLGTSFETVWQDTRFAARTLLKSPGVTSVVILSLALGIGANTAVFSLINALLMKPLPVQQPEQLVLFGDGQSRGFISGLHGRWSIFPYPLYQSVRARQKSFEDVAAFRTQLDRLNVRRYGAASGEAAQLAWGRLVSGNYFSVLGVRPVLGRALTAEDERVAAPVAVLSFNYWQRRFQSSPSVVGKELNMNGVFVTVVGVAPAEFFGESVESELADVWLPLTLQPRAMQRKSALEEAETGWLNLIARLKPAVNMKQAEADVNVTLQQFVVQQAGAVVPKERREELRRSHIALTPGAGGVSLLRTGFSRPLYILLAIVGFVLLIACANVANLLLSRAAAREREMSMRLALGAGRKRLLRQLLTESLLLACLGGAAGVLASTWIVRLLVAGISTGDRAVPLDVSPDFKVLGFTLVVCLLIGLLFGLAPAVRAARVDVWPALKGSAPASRRRLRWGFAQTSVIAQVALSLPLLVGATLFVQSLRQLRLQDFGFSPERVLEVGIDPSIAGYKPDQLEALYRSLVDRVSRVSDVRVASVSHYSPMSGSNWSGGIAVEGYAPPPNSNAFSQWVWVGPRYVETLGMTLLLGRDLTERDTQSLRKVALVNESFVRQYLGGRDPVGRRFSFQSADLESDFEIVGVVRDLKFNDPRQQVWPVAFIPLGQAPFIPARYAEYLEVRTHGEPTSVAAAVREALRQVDPNLPVTGIKTLRQQVDEAVSRERLIAGLAGLFAVLALLLACIGLYGVLAYAVKRRTREIGVRMAVGARRADILKMVLREAFLLTLCGVGIGVAASLAVSGAVSAQLYGLKATDPGAIAGASLVLVAAAGLAGFLPAYSASRVNPMTTLRAE